MNKIYLGLANYLWKLSKIRLSSRKIEKKCPKNLVNSQSILIECLNGVPAIPYDEKLRCSPFKKFEHRPVYSQSPSTGRARLGLDFSFGTVGATTGDSSSRNGASGAPLRKDFIPEEVTILVWVVINVWPSSTGRVVLAMRKLWPLSIQNYFSYTIKTHSSNLSSVAIVCK